MSTTLEEIEAAYIAARRRVFHSGTRGAATPEQWQAWGQEFRDTISQVRAEAQVEALREAVHHVDSLNLGAAGMDEVTDWLMRRADRIARVAGIEAGENDG